MILVTVGDEHTTNLILNLQHVGEVGQDYVYTQQIFVGETHTTIDNNGVVAVFQHRHILANFIKTAQDGIADRQRRCLILLVVLLMKQSL